MPVMSIMERTFCLGAAWSGIAPKAVLPWALNGFEPTGDVLEIGGGGGSMDASLAGTHPSIRLTVTDLDPRMVASMRKRLSDVSNALATEADATALPFDNASFDLVTSHLMLHHVLDWELSISEASRVLRPGGSFVGYDLTDTRAARVVHKLERSPYRLIAAEELAAALDRIGFADVSVTPSGRRHLMRFCATKP